LARLIKNGHNNAKQWPFPTITGGDHWDSSLSVYIHSIH
jgi:hypothetical protein